MPAALRARDVDVVLTRRTVDVATDTPARRGAPARLGVDSELGGVHVALDVAHPHVVKVGDGLYGEVDDGAGCSVLAEHLPVQH